MSSGGGTRSRQRGAILLGLAGGMFVIAGGFATAYYIVGTRSVAAAATASPAEPVAGATEAPPNMAALLSRTVKLTTPSGISELTWAELGVEPDPNEAARVGHADPAKLAAKGALPVRVDRDKAVQALLALKAKTDRAPINAYLDLEARKILDDRAGVGLDVWGSLPRIVAAARAAAPAVELATIALPAHVTRANLGISDISHVLGHWETSFSVSDRDRNYNLKLAASKLDGVVLQPGVQWSFNDTVGERSQKNGYKVAHVITAGEMVDGLAGGTCQISTTLFGAAFFAGIDIVKTINHSRPSAYTPLGFDATVVWPNTDLKLKNSFDFPVVVHYVVANGQAKVEILGKERPYSRIVFEREILEEAPFSSEERLDPEIADGVTSIDQEGFNGYTLERRRKFYKGRKLIKTNKWKLVYKPVTEYIRRGTSLEPDAKVPEEKEHHSLKPPKNVTAAFSQ